MYFKLLEINNVILTAETVSSPGFHLAKCLLASSCVCRKSTAEGWRMATVHAHIIHTIFIKLIWIHFNMATFKWSLFVCDLAARLCKSDLVSLGGITFRTCFSLTFVWASRVVFDFPAGSENCWVWNKGAVRSQQIIIGIAVPVATKPSHFTGVSARESQLYMAFPVKFQSQTKVSFYHTKVPTVKYGEPTIF